VPRNASTRLPSSLYGYPPDISLNTGGFVIHSLSTGSGAGVDGGGLSATRCSGTSRRSSNWCSVGGRAPETTVGTWRPGLPGSRSSLLGLGRTLDSKVVVTVRVAANSRIGTSASPPSSLRSGARAISDS